MPPLLTYAARVSDGLPLVASFDPSSSGGGGADGSARSTEEHKRQAKDLLRNLSGGRTTGRTSIETSGNNVFHHLVRDGICYLTLTEGSYPRRLAFLYLEECADAFVGEMSRDYGDRWRIEIDTAARPYQFIKADPALQRLRRNFVDPTSRQNATKLNEDLSEIHSIMRRNIEEVLNRGEKLENVSAISSKLVDQSKEFKWGAKKLTWQAMVNQYGPMAAMGAFVLFVLYMKFF